LGDCRSTVYQDVDWTMTEGRRIDRMIRQVDIGPLASGPYQEHGADESTQVLAERCPMSARRDAEQFARPALR
jgi:hypothetical protein